MINQRVRLRIKIYTYSTKFVQLPVLILESQQFLRLVLHF